MCGAPLYQAIKSHKTFEVCDVRCCNKTLFAFRLPGARTFIMIMTIMQMCTSNVDGVYNMESCVMFVLAFLVVGNGLRY